VRVRTIILAAAIVAVAAVALGRLHPFGDPRADRLQGPDADTRTLLQTSGIPAPARKVLVDNCADCHSNATHWRFYARVAPFSWLVERDVIEGRKHMNLSHWSELTPEKRDQLESKILLETKKGSMPPLQYRLVHWGNGISADDMKALSMLVPQGQTGASNASLQGDAARRIWENGRFQPRIQLFCSLEKVRDNLERRDPRPMAQRYRRDDSRKRHGISSQERPGARRFDCLPETVKVIQACFKKDCQQPAPMHAPTGKVDKAPMLATPDADRTAGQVGRSL
jgi:hypothetical protein